MRLSDTLKRWLVSAGITVFLSVNLLAFLAVPQRANAQLDAAITSAFTAKWTWEKVESSLYSSLLASLINGASYFMRKIAYDTARYVASGGTGQGALAFQNGAGAYFAEVAGNTAGEIIDQFGKPFGLDLCKPPDLKVQTYLQVSLRRIYDENGNGPQPNCSFQQLTSNWGNIQEQYKQQGKDVGQAFADSLRVNQGDFGIALGLAAKVDRNVTAARAGASTDRIEGNGFKPLTNLISGEIKTPAQVIQSETESVSGKNQTELSFQQLNGIYGSGALQIIPMAASVFLNTLTSQLLDSVLSGGLFPTGGDGSAVIDVYSSAVNRNRELAEKAFSYLIASIPTQLTSYDILAQYSSCPEDGRLAGVNNCVINSQLRQALDRKTNPLTIAEAIKEGFLDPNAELIPPSREADNSDKMGCMSDKKYCYSNVQKMRKVRILPLGFEIATLKSDPDQPWRLGQVVAGFEDCVKNPNGIAIPDATKPFCHLIDPNWVLKVPDAQCQAQVITERLETETAPNRREECADISTCLAKDEKGACISYGHCTQEKNVWRLGAQSCREEFNTCRTFVNTRDNSVVSYLTRTMDYGECTQESVGCRAYSLEQAGDSWVASAQNNANLKKLGRPQTMYFGDKIKNFACTPAAEGATAFFPVLASGGKSLAPVYLKKAPDYLGCYDVDPSTAVIDYASSEAELAQINTNAQCANFAGACAASEVGCRLYRPQDGAPELTAKIGANRCDVQCIGYDTFKQEASAFEGSQFPLHFIPSQATACPAESRFIGCSEFTNLDSAAAGGESLEYYSSLKYCEKPLADGSNVQTYYTWEGTVSQGYVLRVHKMLPLRANEANYIAQYNLGAAAQGQFVVGSPAYSPDSRADVENFVAKCNQTNYQLGLNDPFNANRADADCRAFYNDQGAIFYRLMAQTVTVDSTCHALRKTEPALVVDPDITDAGICSQRAGLWQNAQCQRCAGGGQYKDGACIYQTISRPGESVSCAGSARKDQYNGCRAYTGNTVGNIQTVLSTEGTFEPASAEPTALLAAKAGWSAGTVKPEAIQVGQYSLSVVGGDSSVMYTFASGTVKKGETYELQFWARGDANNLTIGLTQGQTIDLFTFDPVAKIPLALTINQEWRPYRLGPIQFTGNGNTNDVKLFFRKSVASANVQLYLDNVSMTRLTDKKAFIKSSWRVANGGRDVPLACDSNPTDAFPGEALGCRAYTDLNNQRVTQATGFEKLCRPQAAGCSALYDSRNTLDTEKTAVFNAWCAGPQGNCTITIGTTAMGTCTIKAGQAGCFVNRLDLSASQVLPDSHIAKSTVIVPADTSTSTPVYLTDRSEFRLADGSQLGCQKVALENQNLPTAGTNSASSSAFTFSQSFFRNDPALYEDILCRDDLVGCGEFRAGSEVRYARDPKLVGNKLCSYKEDLQLGGTGTKASGWFMDGVGRCSDGNLCRADGDCGTGNKCVGIGEVACYADSILPGGEYGIWSQKTANYQGFVGQCPAEANNCTELVDPADKDEINVSGKPYYAILDEAFRNRSAACDGKASLKNGCVLFNQTEVPNKLFSSQATYQASIANNNQPVAPISNSANDSNIILKVDRDRQCSEWLACKASMTVQDPATGKTKRLCYQYSACRKLGPTGACEEWVTVDKTPNPRLTENVYVGRATTWQAPDYTGFSLFNKYPVADYTYVNFEGDMKSYLAYEIPESVLAENSEAPACTVGGVAKPDGSACGDNGGRCYQARCLYPIGGSFAKGITETNAGGIKEALNPGICKSFPEKDSPYPQGLALSQKPQGNEIKTLTDGSKNPLQRVEFLNKKPDFSGSNVCQGDNGAESCSCEYQKVTYKSGQTDHWPVANTRVPQGICTVGEKPANGSGTDNMVSTVGQPCRNNADCGVAGSCSPMNRKELRAGQRGFCLEYDLSSPLGFTQNHQTGEKKQTYPCLTWLPIETSASAFDIYNAYLDAGYNPDTDGTAVAGGVGGGELYCLATTARPKTVVDLYNFDEGTGYLKNPGGTFGDRAGIENCRLGNQTGGFTSWSDKMCGTSGPAHRTHMEDWVENYFGTNATLLRVEGGLLATRMTIEDAGLVWRNEAADGTPGSKITADNKEAKIVYALAPAIHGCRLEYGTIMHPPRTFDEPDFVGVEPASKLYTYLQNPAANLVLEDPVCGANSQSKLEAGKYNIASIYYSPGPTMAEKLMPTHKRDYVYRSQYEGKMNEADLEKVCFVPMAYTESKEQDQAIPAMMQHDNNNKGLCINFAKHEGEKVIGPNGVRFINEAKSGAGFFSKEVNADGLFLWTFMAEGEKLKAMSYSDYSSQKYTDGFVNAPDKDPRNEIARRYVAVVFNAKPGDQTQNQKCVPRFAQPAIAALYQNSSEQSAEAFIPTPDNDPFGVKYSYSDQVNDVSSGCDSPAHTWRDFLAIGMDFNAQGEFLGYISRWVNVHNINLEAEADGNFYGDRPHGFKFAVVAVRQNQCVSYAQVHNPANLFTEVPANKAWTNRIWRGNTQFKPEKLSALERDTRQGPYGSTRLSGDLINDAWSLRTYTFMSMEDGVPLSCAIGLFNTIGSNAPDSCIGLENIIAGPIKGALTNLAKSSNGQNEALAQARETLLSFFARINVERFVGVSDTPSEFGFYNNTDATFVPSLSATTTTDVSGSQGLGAPIIYSLNPATCRSSSEAGCNAAERDAFSINSRNYTLADYNNDGRAEEDVNFDGSVDPIIASKSYPAILQFFAGADDNRMPIKRVKIDWGDGKDPFSRSGLYKNRKPFCELTSDTGTPTVGRCTMPGSSSENIIEPLTCRLTTQNGQLVGVDSDCAPNDLPGEKSVCALQSFRQFGDLERSCKAGYFEFVNQYNCSKTIANAQNGPGVRISDLDTEVSFEAQQRVAQMMRPGTDLNETKVCVFKPRVQVQDNWGWCNGTCAKPPNGQISYGCYDSMALGGAKQCSDPSDNFDHWTEYNGSIIVLPE